MEQISGEMKLVGELQSTAQLLHSFQQEISARSSSLVEVVDLTSSDSGESQPDLGYLLEACDDELGLPPATVSRQKAKNDEFTELVRVSSRSSGICEFWGFEDGISEYVGFEEGLFDYSSIRRWGENCEEDEGKQNDFIF
ncbi:hypothetical protein EZV62_027008 [Acer yangbiense]|uniref:Uncharacterized protein n=1 Tax=Acer yangbiense TaxID=1000413 RepID=A0A5C7GSF5_9ROSI|nr:hypothetical protein EZV62_027008 [Acer yangbiense]